MKRALSALASVSALFLGCASTDLARVASQTQDEAPPVEIDQTTDTTTEETPEADETSGAVETAREDTTDPRRIGDYVTFQFRGTALRAPVRLTERVTGRDAETLTVDYTFTGERSSETLRVRTTLIGREVRSVESIREGGLVLPAKLADFETRMAGTVAIADENEALISETRRTLKIGTQELEATESAYRVRIGAKAATLKTLAADGFAWGDAGGEIVAKDGKLLYKAELVDMGGGPAPVAVLDVENVL